MNPDTTPQPNDEEMALEAQLRALPSPLLPPAWRAEILSKTEPPAWPWLPRPVRWALAACWVATGAIHLATPAEELSSRPHGAEVRSYPHPPGDEASWIASLDTSSGQSETVTP